MTRPTTPMRERDRSDRRDERSRSKGKKKDIGVPGAGTLYVYGYASKQSERENEHSPRRKRLSRRSDRLLRKDNLTWLELSETSTEPSREKSPDGLLERGIDGYTFIPAERGGVLGRGKFSTVYKVNDCQGVEYALKHTPLHPHHPLIAARLLREPTLLAQLPIHPCLVGVHSSIRTPGHFYLIEEYASTHVPLPAHPTPLLPSRAAYILDQLVSVVRDCLHSGGRVVHRDLKGENILIDVDSGDLLLLDLGLATHYSASQPKLTTCCGSPAFHSPEIVRALNRPPGEITYYGPELDIWCIGLTVLSLLLEIRFPLGPSHKSTYVMRERVLDRLQELDELYPSSAPYRHVKHGDLDPDERREEVEAWQKVRRAIRGFLDLDGIKRMSYFDAYEIGDKVRQRVFDFGQRQAGDFKEVSFIPTDIKYPMPLYIVSDSNGPIVMSNHTGLSERKVLSYFKYVLRSRGILYHAFRRSETEEKDGKEDHGQLFQLVLPFPAHTAERIAAIPKRQEIKKDSWVSSLLSGPKRAASVPPQHIRHSPVAEEEKKGSERFLKCWARIEVEKPVKSPYSRAASRRGSADVSCVSSPPTPVSPVSPLMSLIAPTPLEPLTTLQEGVPTDRPYPPSRAHSVDGRALPRAVPKLGRTSSASRVPRRPHPLSRNVSMESELSSSAGAGANHASAATVTITLSDSRGYGVLRKALEIGQNMGINDTPVSAVSSTLVDHTSAKQSSAEDEEEAERGRPRSKEDSKILVVERESPRPVEISCPAPKQARPRSRGKKTGFLEGWFGIGGESKTPARSSSSPPSSGASSPIAASGRT